MEPEVVVTTPLKVAPSDFATFITGTFSYVVADNDNILGVDDLTLCVQIFQAMHTASINLNDDYLAVITSIRQKAMDAFTEY